MKSNNVRILLVIGLLLTVLGVSYLINRGDIENKLALNKEAIFEIVVDGQVKTSYNMEDISKMGEVTFSANLKSSGKDPVAHEYTGVLLKTIFEEAGLNPEQSEGATITAIDGYAAALTKEKLMSDDNVFLAYRRDGQLLGDKSNGGDGPYQLVISKDKFSQFWVKYAYQGELLN